MRKVYVIIDETMPCAECIIGVYTSKLKAERVLRLKKINLDYESEYLRITTEVLL